MHLSSPAKHDPQKLTQKQLDTALDAHEKWLENRTFFFGLIRAGRRADFTGMDLSGLRFTREVKNGTASGRDVRCAVFKDATLVRSDISFANLSGADITSINAQGAIGISVDFRGCNMQAANLGNADLRNAIFEYGEKKTSEKFSFRAALSDAVKRLFGRPAPQRWQTEKVPINLHTANLSGANLLGASVGAICVALEQGQKIDLSGAILKPETTPALARTYLYLTDEIQPSAAAAAAQPAKPVYQDLVIFSGQSHNASPLSLQPAYPDLISGSPGEAYKSGPSHSQPTYPDLMPSFTRAKGHDRQL
ncbi:MAG TPA: pentapeptide repeat-containing protein [Candidatus Baltobacteraceae bacterium]|jgi:uncharacterized protein YjbI with pentapeptide repeats|nr:pentapeptide repeat-containing protein [Candidatus Baltobacteraceae bacterium]